MRDQETRKQLAPRNPRFFYGWIIVAVVFLAEFAGSGLGGLTLGLFFKPMTQDLGWSLTQLTGAITASSIAGICVGPIVGPLLDRYGARPVMVVGTLIAGAGLLLLAGIQHVWQFWVLYAVVAALGLGELGGLTGPVIVAKWFMRQRGRAMAFATLGLSAGGMVMAPIIGVLIDAIGWRKTWGVMGVGLLVVMLPLVLLFIRRQPEDMGLRPDGDEAVRSSGEGGMPLGQRNDPGEPLWTLTQAMRTRSFWLLVVAMNLTSLSTSVQTLHVVPYLTQQKGMSTMAASYVLTARLFGLSILRIPWGFIVERVPVRMCLAWAFLARSTSVLALVIVPFPFNIIPFVVLSGVGGGFGLLQPMFFANYYGRSFMGSIQGALRPLLGFSSLVGPLLIAMIFDATKTFDLAFLITSIMGIPAAGIILFATPPKRHPAAAEA